MEPEQFIELALRTESNNFPEIVERLSNPRNIRLLHAAMGLCTEANEFLDIMKKFIFYGKPIDEVNLAEELGDSDWYKAIACDVLDKSFEEIWIAVINKLSHRYGMNFNVTSAINRNLKNEREGLELDLKTLKNPFGYTTNYHCHCDSLNCNQTVPTINTLCDSCKQHGCKVILLTKESAQENLNKLDLLNVKGRKNNGSKDKNA